MKMSRNEDEWVSSVKNYKTSSLRSLTFSPFPSFDVLAGVLGTDVHLGRRREQVLLGLGLHGRLGALLLENCNPVVGLLLRVARKEERAADGVGWVVELECKTLANQRVGPLNNAPSDKNVIVGADVRGRFERGTWRFDFCG